VQYAALFVHLEEVRDSDEVRETLECDLARTYPVCVGFAGDSPVEYWDEEEPEEPQPFDLAEVNHRLAALVERE
jgi:hypothetical protein